MTNTFGERLSNARRSKGMKQQELAEHIGKKQTVVGKYERGEVTPSIETVLQMAKVLDISIVYLLGNEQETTILKDKSMIKRLLTINNLANEDRNHILKTLDALLREAQTRNTFQEA